MPTWTIQSEYEHFDAKTIYELKSRALAYLRKHPFDDEGLIKHLEISIECLYDLRAEFHSEFALVEQRALKKIERYQFAVALGTAKKIDKDRLSTGKWILNNRSARYARKATTSAAAQSPTPSPDEPLQETNGKGESIWERYQRENGGE